MDIQSRIEQSEQKFKEQQEIREQHLKSAEECLTEMTKLQGEWRVLQDLLPKKPNKKANTIDVVPEETK